MKSMVEETLAQFGKIDVLCNNAAVLFFEREAPAHELSRETWDQTMAVNLRGYWLTSKYVIPNMLRSKRGSVIHVASPTGIYGFTRLTAYSASKGGVLGLMRAMAADYAPEGIRVNAIIPGTIDTPMNAQEFSSPEARERYAAITPARRLGTPRGSRGNGRFPCFGRVGLLCGGHLHRGRRPHCGLGAWRCIPSADCLL